MWNVIFMTVGGINELNILYFVVKCIDIKLKFHIIIKNTVLNYTHKYTIECILIKDVTG